MATTNITVAENKGRVFDSICRKLGWSRGGCQGLKKRAKFFSTGAPVIAKEQYASYAGVCAITGDLAYDYAAGSENAYILTVAPAAATDSTFVKMNA